MLSKRTIGTILAALLALPSCGWQSDGLTRLEELYPSPPPAPPDPCPPPDDAALPAVTTSGTCSGLASGHWAVRMVQYGSMSPSGMGPWRITLSDHFLATPAADGKTLDLTFCAQTSSLTDSKGTAIALGKTSMPDKTRKAIGAATLKLPLPGDGTFQAADVAWLWGVKDLANPVTDSVPSDPSDPHVWDQDADGHPGVTVDVENPAGERYMARRSTWSFANAAITPEWITGKLTFAVLENALGASIDLLKTVAPITPRTECTSVYQLRCVEAAYTCEQVSANAKALWRDAPK